MKFPKKKIININKFYKEYIQTLNDVLNSVDFKKLKMFSNYYKKLF